MTDRIQGLARATCPIKECEYWVTFGGYFDAFVKALYRHFKTHSELSYGELRVPGGLLDQVLGDAILAALASKESNP